MFPIGANETTGDDECPRTESEGGGPTSDYETIMTYCHVKLETEITGCREDMSAAVTELTKSFKASESGDVRVRPAE